MESNMNANFSLKLPEGGPSPKKMRTSPEREDSISFPRDLILFVKYGIFDSLGVNTPEAYQEADALKPLFAKNYTPLCELNPLFQTILVKTEQTNQAEDLTEITEIIKNLYKSMIEQNQYSPGPFGDQIRITQLDNDSFLITQIAQNAFLKPGLAADIIPVFIHGPLDARKIFVLTGTRKFEPGKGKNATLGGFTGITPRDKDQPLGLNNSSVLDSPIYTALKEGKEEGNLRIEVPEIENLRENYDATNIFARVICGSRQENNALAYDATIVKLGIFKTSDALIKNGGECLPDGLKRVYNTTAFAVICDVGEEFINIEEKTTDAFLSHFKFSAADDIAGLQIHDMTYAVKNPNAFTLYELSSRLEFGIEHHNDFINPLVTLMHHFCEENNITLDHSSNIEEDLLFEMDSTQERKLGLETPEWGGIPSELGDNLEMQSDIKELSPFGEDETIF